MSILRLPSLGPRWREGAAFAALYIFWGSTFLGMRLAVETIPPFVMAGGRYTLAGIILFMIARVRRVPLPSWGQWRSAVIIGAMLSLGNNGLQTWALQFVPSGIAAVMASTVSLWMILLDWRAGGKVRPTTGTALGLVLGLSGIALLTLPSLQGSSGSINLLGIGALLFAAFSWAAGSLYSRQADVPASPLMGTSLQMLMGGLWLLTTATLTGEMGQFRFDLVSPRSLLAVGYLIIFGQLVGLTCYMWLLRVSTPARVSTYAFVNPVVAVFLGWALANEPVTVQTLVATFVILAGVVMITLNQPKPKPRAANAPPRHGEQALELDVEEPLQDMALPQPTHGEQPQESGYKH